MIPQTHELAFHFVPYLQNKRGRGGGGRERDVNPNKIKKIKKIKKYLEMWLAIYLKLSRRGTELYATGC
jgi:hypothetical protein